jgi:WD40 repeat protein
VLFLFFLHDFVKKELDQINISDFFSDLRVTGQQIHTIKEAHSNCISSIRYFSPDGNQVVSASYDNSLKIWDFRTSEVVMHFARLHSNGITCMEVLPDEVHTITHIAEIITIISYTIWRTTSISLTLKFCSI